MTGSSSGCSYTFAIDGSVTLIPSPNSTSTFDGWGACSGTANCAISMTSAKTTSAIFSVAPKAMIGTQPYTSLFAAYTAALNDEIIMTLDSEMPDSGLTINTAVANGKTVHISGGYKADYKSRTGVPTYLKAPLKISSGTLTIDRLTIR